MLINSNRKLILGLSVSGHDCSYALSDYQGNILLHCELEREIRIKEVGGSSLLYSLLDERLSSSLLNISVITIAACPVNIQTFNRLNTLKGNSEESSQSIDEFLQFLRSHTPLLEDYYNHRKVLGNFELLLSGLDEVLIFGHHRCHVAEAWGSFDQRRNGNNVIYTFDGGGFDFDEEGNKKETHTSITNTSSTGLGDTSYDWITSLGGTYIETTGLLGFSNGPPKGSQEGSVMGLAAYGRPEIYSHLFSNDALWMNTATHNPRRAEVFYQRQLLKENILRISSSGEWELEKANIAASLQQEFEDRFLRIIMFGLKRMRNNIYPEGLEKTNILLSGGCSLNCAVAGKLAFNLKSKKEFRHIGVFVSPVPYDAGLSIGSIFCYIESHSKEFRMTRIKSYLGHNYSKIEIRNSVSGFKLKENKLSTTYLAELLSNGKVIALFQGRSESGRRALCNRSILADPRNPKIRDVLNQKVKHRPMFRPFAPVILREHVNDWFEVDLESPFMSHAIPFRKERINQVPSVVHKDGTGRLQTLSKEDNPWMYELLTKWFNLTGCPILINTSFNDNEPIVETPSNALSCFIRTSIDYLVFPDIGVILSGDKD